MKRRAISLLLASMMTIAIFNGCSNEKVSFTPGTYEATTQGRKANIKVAVTFDEKSITDVKVLEHHETKGISDIALEQIPSEIVEKQSVGVDSVTGATFTSLAIVNAVKDTIKQAGGEVEALNIKEKETAGKLEEVEENVDIAIIGGGATGLMAALTAAKAGQNVVVYEKLPYVGGNLLSAAGVISGAGTKLHEEGGVDLSPEKYLASRVATAQDKESKYYAENPEYTELFFELNRDMTNMLIDSGVEFVPNPKGVSHVLQPGYFQGCGQFAGWLAEEVKKAGGKIVTETEVTEITSKDGIVTGLVASGKDKLYKVNAKSVILASGGFTSNKEIIGEYYPQYADLYSTAQVSTLGDGLEMAEKVGATAHAMDSGVHKMYITSKSKNEIPFFLFDVPSIAVNANGKRFIDEGWNYSINSGEMLKEENGGYGYFIFDEEAKATFDEKYNGHYKGLEDLGDVKSYNSIDEMATDLEIPELVNTVTRYNEQVAAGKDEDFNRKSLNALEGEKFYAIKVEPGLYLTYGGVKVDLNMRALDAEGNSVKGLYAAGDVAGSFEVQEGFRYTAGVTQALSFGKLAVETAIKDMQ